jgi:hypothetical protein
MSVGQTRGCSSVNLQRTQLAFVQREGIGRNGRDAIGRHLVRPGNMKPIMPPAGWA